MMPYVYRDPRSLEKQPLAGAGNCVDLIKALVPGLIGLPTSAWRQGARVLDTSALLPGTAIATFVNGRYPNRPHGNHAAIFVAYAGASIWVMDQWKADSQRPWIGLRLIYPGKKWRDGTFVDPSNSAGAFYVIER
jgi:hypothetical protein